MRLVINSKPYDATNEQDEQFYETIVMLLKNEFEKIPEQLQTAIKGVIRLSLTLAEIKYPELRDDLRKPKDVSIIDHCLNLIRPQILGQIKHGTVGITTGEGGCTDCPGSLQGISIQLPSQS